MPTVDCYIRISREGNRSDDQIAKLLAQYERECRALARQEGLKVGMVFTETDVSGSSRDRAQLNLVLERYRSGKSAGLVVPNLSRLVREVGFGLELLEEFGPDLHAPDVADHATPNGRFANTVRMAVDEMQRRDAAKKFAKSRKGAIELGISVNFTPPGYRKREDRRLEPNPDTAPHIREAFEMRARGAGPMEIGAYLTANGVRTAVDSVGWSTQSVYALLRNRAFLGEIRSGEFVNTEAHEPIVDELLFAAAERPKKGPHPPRQRGEGQTRNLLRGLLRCTGCGYVMQKTNDPRGNFFYRCQRKHPGGICEAPARITADLADGIVEHIFLDHVEPLVGPQHDRELRKGARKPNDPAAPLRAAVEDAKRRVAQLETEEMQDQLGERYGVVFQQRREALAEAQDALAAATYAEPDAPDYTTLRELWYRPESKELGLIAQRNAVLKDLFDCFTLAREKDDDGHPVLRGLVRGQAPADLPRSGCKRNPQLRPLD